MEKFLLYDGQEWYYLGYRLRISASASLLLRTLYVGNRSGMDGALLSRLVGKGRGRISALVREINESAYLIGQRPLILSGRAEGYRLNQNL